MDAPEPLEGQIYTLDQLREMNRLDGDKELVFVIRVKLAVEWLKNYIRDSKTIGDKGMLNADYVLERIDEAFPNLNSTKKPNKTNQ